MVTRAGRELREAERPDLPAHRRLAQRDAELLPNPLHQVDQPPAHHAMDRRNRAALDNAGQLCPLVAVQFRLVARRLAVAQALRPALIEPQHPVADGLQPNPADPRRFRPPPAVINHRQGQKPTRLIGVLGRSRQPPQGPDAKIPSQADCCSHGEPPPFATGSQKSARLGIPKMSPPSQRLVSCVAPRRCFQRLSSFLWHRVRGTTRRHRPERARESLSEEFAGMGITMQRCRDLSRADQPSTPTCHACWSRRLLARLRKPQRCGPTRRTAAA